MMSRIPSLEEMQPLTSQPSPNSPENSPEIPADAEELSAYDLFVSVAALISLVVVGYREMVPSPSEVAELLDLFDLAFCLVFFLDFVRNTIRAPDRKRYLRGWGIFDLASSIPVIEAFRILRIVRLVRIFRALRSIRILYIVARKNRPAAIFVAGLTLTIGLFVGICVAVLELESTAPGANLLTAHDVLWWAVVTSSTVGYGNEYPVTAEGRLLAGILMFVGIGLFATASGAIAGMGIRSLNHPSDEPDIHRELRALRESIGRIESHLDAGREEVRSNSSDQQG